MKRFGHGLHQSGKFLVSFNNHVEGKVGVANIRWFTYGGEKFYFDYTVEGIKADNISPVISNIEIENGSEWSKTKSIVVSGTENYCNTVTLEIFDSEENIIFNGQAFVVNGSYSISYIPEIESNLEGKIFIAKVTDGCGNSTREEFTLSKIDFISPTPLSKNEIGGDWMKSKDFTFTATDNGIGEVSIAFNDIGDLRLAKVDGGIYSRDYKFVGDVYSPKELSVLYKDGLGNTSIQKITIDKIDNTSPTITNVELHNNKLVIESNDECGEIGEGSGVNKYRYLASTEKLETPEVRVDNSIEVLKSQEMIIKDVYKIKYVYVVAEDLVRKCK